MLAVVPLYRLSIIPDVGNAILFHLRPLARGYTELCPDENAIGA